jgi:hypothetical protein
MEGESVDFRSDIYSLGVTLYYTVSGRLPPSGTSFVSAARSQATPTPVTPQLLDRSIPTEVENLMLKMMAEAKEDRFASYPDLVRAIDDAIGSCRPGEKRVAARAPAAPAVRGGGSWIAPLVVALGVLLGLAIVGFALKGDGAPGVGPPSLKVRTDPEGAEVHLDGTFLGTTPVDLEEVRGGVLLLKLEGYRPVEVTPELEPGDRGDLFFHLEALPD